MTLIKCRLFISLAFLLLCGGISSQGYFDYNDQLDSAYRDIVQLNTETAQAKLNQLKQTEPDNLAIFHVENYIDFFTVFLKEEKKDLDDFADAKEERLKRLSNGQESPHLRFAQAEVHLQYALARSKFGQYIRAGWDIHRANKLLLENKRLYPEFALNSKSLSIIHALMGSLKGLRRSIILLFTSLDGDVEEGIKEIQSLYDNKTKDVAFFSTEIVAIRALVAQHVEKDGPRAIEIISNPDRDVVNGPLFKFVKASILQLNQREVAAIPLLDSIVSQETELPFDYVHLMLGISRLHQLDPESYSHIQYFIRHFRGRHYIKEAYQKLGWYELLINDDPKEYRKWMTICKELGNTDLGEDQQAQHEAENETIPNRELLQTRVLSDGGYYNRALLLIQHINIDQLDKEEKIEYYYRLGRINQGLNITDNAVQSYGRILQYANDDKRYFICNAALQLGIIHTEQSEWSKAKSMFETCLSIKPEEHRNSLHQKAKSWLERIELNKKTH